MEPERKIEKLLRACANKRRADAGDAFKLHPATRRTLQGEVARQRPKQDGVNDSPSFWNWLRVRWVLPLVFALLVCLGVAVFWPAMPSKQNLAFNKAAASAKELPASAVPPIAGVDNSAPLPAPSAAPVTLHRPTTPAAATTELAYAPPQANLSKDTTPAVMFSDEGGADRARRQETTTVTNSAPPIATVAGNPASGSVTALPPPVIAAPPAAVPALASEPPGAATTANLALSVPPGGVSGAVATEGLAPAASSRALRAAKAAPAASSAKFKSEVAMDSLQVNAAKNSQRFVQAPLKKNLSVLASFEVQQNGDQISVVDRDGSIYKGTLQPMEPAEKQTDSAKSQTTSKLGAAQLQQNKFGAANPQPQSAQNYFFRVAGANRSLKQNVVFAGNLMPISNLTANAGQKFQNFGGGGGAGGQSKLADATAAQQQTFSNSRIEGTVTIGRTNQIEINAMPVP